MSNQQERKDFHKHLDNARNRFVSSFVEERNTLPLSNPFRTSIDSFLIAYDQAVDSSKKSYTEEEVIDLILQERNRCRKICDDHTGWFQRRIEGFTEALKPIYEEGKDACRRIRICISQVSVLDSGEKTDQQKIKDLYFSNGTNLRRTQDSQD